MVSTEQSEANPSSPAAGGDFGANEWLVEEMYERYWRDPASVDAAWHDFFADYRPADAARAQDGLAVRPATTETKSDAVPRRPSRQRLEWRRPNRVEMDRSRPSRRNPGRPPPRRAQSPGPAPHPPS